MVSPGGQPKFGGERRERFEAGTERQNHEKQTLRASTAPRSWKERWCHDGDQRQHSSPEEIEAENRGWKVLEAVDNWIPRAQNRACHMTRHWIHFFFF